MYHVRNACPTWCGMARVGVLVADSGAFIKGASLEQWSSSVVTVKEVLSEIRDSNTRRRLQVLAYELSFSEPSQAALRHGEFSQLCLCIV